jgi:large subunit ribosomal protein L9
MEVILRERVDNLGVKGDVVKVSDGYARNFLLPKKLAVTATVANRQQIEHEKAIAVRREAIEKQEAEVLAEQLSKVSIRLSRKVGENDILYGSVTSMDLAEALHEKGYTIDRRKIEMEDHLKSVGQFKVPVKLHRDLTVFLNVEVVREE